MSVEEDGTDEILGNCSRILIHPDTGRIEGFFVTVPGFLRSEELFLSSFDILRWGTRISVRDHNALAPIEDRVRLQPLLEERRPVFGQRIQTEGGRFFGRCCDVQFDTRRFIVEWLFPKRLLRWGVPIPISEVVEVRREAIVVREPSVKETAREEERAPLLQRLPEIAEA